MKKILLLLLSLSIFGYCPAQKKDKKLYSQIAMLLKDFKGDVGVYVKNLNANDKSKRS